MSLSVPNNKLTSAFILHISATTAAGGAVPEGGPPTERAMGGGYVHPPRGGRNGRVIGEPLEGEEREGPKGEGRWGEQKRNWWGEEGEVGQRLREEGGEGVLMGGRQKRRGGVRGAAHWGEGESLEMEGGRGQREGPWLGEAGRARSHRGRGSQWGSYPAGGERAFGAWGPGCPPDPRKKRRGFNYLRYFNYLFNLNPLTPRRTEVSPFTEISILF